MKYKFCSFCINVTKYDVTFSTMGGSNSPKTPMVTPLVAVQYMLRMSHKCLITKNRRFILLNKVHSILLLSGSDVVLNKKRKKIY